VSTYVNQSRASDPYAATAYEAFPVTGTYAGPVYQGTPGDCVARTLPSGYVFYRLGAVIAPDSWVAFSDLKPGAAAPAPNDLYQEGTRVHLVLEGSSDGLVNPSSRGWNDPPSSWGGRAAAA
jgi:hypothetical protein